MNKEAFFNRTRQTKTIEVDGLGDVTFRKLTQGDVECIRRNFGTDKPLEAARFVVTRAVSDENGVRIFDDKDKDRLAEIEVDAIEQIAQAIAVFSGLIKEQPEEGSSQAPKAGSPN